MKPNNLLLAFIAFWVVTISLVRCDKPKSNNEMLVSTSIAVELPDIEIEPLPLYLGFVLPEPGSIQALEILQINVANVKMVEAAKLAKPDVCLSFDPYLMMEPGDFLSKEEVFSRLSLDIDGVLINEVQVILSTDDGPRDGPQDPETSEPSFQAPGGAPHILCFPVGLDIGEHTATFIARKTSGEELRYTWSFFLVDFPDTEVALQPLPLYLRHAQPGPGDVLTVQSYTEQSTFFSLSGREPSVCVQVGAYEISVALGGGISPTEKEMVSWSTLEIDGEEIANVQSHSKPSDFPSQHNLCFIINLGIGVHTATFIVHKPGGKDLSYLWPFMLVE